MQVDINPIVCRERVGPEEATKGVKRRCRVAIQQRVAQTRLADLSQRLVQALVARVAEAHFPVPRLEIIAEFSHLTFQSNIEDVIPVGKLLASDAGVVNTTKPNAGSHWDPNPVKNHGRICYCERIKRISNWHTDPGRAKPYAGWVTKCVHTLKRIGRKRSSREG